MPGDTTGEAVEVHGDCDGRFQPVRDAFARNFDEDLELGACVAVTLDAEPVVDLWAGNADEQDRPWAADTIVNVYSTTKTMAALCVLMVADRGLVDFDAPVADYWPEFAQNGKDGVLVRHVMSHSSGLPGFDDPIEVDEFYDWDAIVGRLAAQAPMWEPGTASGYHAVTQGYLQGEIVRRVTGKTLGTFFREEVAEPLQADFHIGLPPEHDARVAELLPPDRLPMNTPADPDSVQGRTFLRMPFTALEPRTGAWRAAEIPAAGGIGNARSIARVLSALACGGEADGVRLLSEGGLAKVLEQQTDGKDLVLARHIRFGIGYGLWSEDSFEGPTDRWFYWGGWGGSHARIDLDARLSIAYAMNRMASAGTPDVRARRIVEAAYAIIG